MNSVYILRQDLYNEWAWENGATNLICVSYDIDYIVNKLKQYCEYEIDIDNNRIIDDPDMNLDTLINLIKCSLRNGSNCEYINVYVNLDDYNNGKESGTFVIEKMNIER